MNSLAFHALNLTSAGSSDVSRGVAPLTEGRTDTIYLPDNAGSPIWLPYASGVPGKVYANGQWWFYSAPAATNSCPDSSDLGGGTAWSGGGGASRIQNQVGLRGEANGASLITDPGGSFSIVFNNSITGDARTVIILVKKEASTSYPGFDVGASRHILNSNTGTLVTVTATNLIAVEVNDVGVAWEVLIQVGNTTDVLGLYPQLSSDGSTLDSAATGSAVIMNVDVRIGATIAQVRGTSPIFTASGSASVTASDPSFDDANHDDTEGAYYCEIKNVGIDGVNDAGLIGMGTDGRILYSSDANGFKSFDGVNTASGPVITLAADDTEYKVALAYGSSKQRINTDDSWGTEATFDGVYNNAENKLNILHDDVTTGAPEGVVLKRDLRRYDMTYAEGIIAIPPMMNGIFPSQGGDNADHVRGRVGGHILA